MSFDIYGENLRSGHCEVHPHVHEEFPCSVCLQENYTKKHALKVEKEYCEAQAKHYRESIVENINGAGI